MSWKRRIVQFDLAAVWKRRIFVTFPPRPKSGWKVDQLSIFSRVASEPRLASIINFVEGVSSLIVETNISSLRWLWVQRSRSSQRRTLMSFSSRCSPRSYIDILDGFTIAFISGARVARIPSSLPWVTEAPGGIHNHYYPPPSHHHLHPHYQVDRWDASRDERLGHHFKMLAQQTKVYNQFLNLTIRNIIISS